ncbi:MAG: invasion associated locus B family protein [Alphaproteobacteria bacterium]|nr:invasion associated locus B family protein [Alphaproteobacteria bacterium]
MNDQMRTWLTRGGIALGVFIVGMIAGWLAHGGRSDVARVNFYKDWRLACPADTDAKSYCALASDVVEPKTGTHLAQVTWGVEASKPDTHVIVVSVPLTVLIQPGLGLQVGDKTTTYKYATCLPTGCVVTIPVDDKLADAMQSATTLGIVVTSERGEPITLPVSVQGFKDAYGVMNATEGKRKSWWKRLWS